MRYIIMGRRAFLGCCLLAVTLVVVLVYGTVRVAQTAGAPLHNHPIYSVETERWEVALGINCAWDNADIPTLIKILDDYDIKATFFVVGDWCDKYPESVKALYDAGHEIGSHSDTHADLTRLDRAGIIRELQDSADKIEAITGERPTLVRPPSGAYNANVVQIIEEQGFIPIQWDCDSIDYRNPTTDEMKARIFKKLRRGSILLFHSGARNTPAALPRIIESIQERGYSFVPVSQLIHEGEYTLDHEGRQFPVKTAV